jgi:hypothetical protein
MGGVSPRPEKKLKKCDKLTDLSLLLFKECVGSISRQKSPATIANSAAI